MHGCAAAITTFDRLLRLCRDSGYDGMDMQSCSCFPMPWSCWNKYATFLLYATLLVFFLFSHWSPPHRSSPPCSACLPCIIYATVLVWMCNFLLLPYAMILMGRICKVAPAFLCNGLAVAQYNMQLMLHTWQQTVTGVDFRVQFQAARVCSNDGTAYCH